MHISTTLSLLIATTATLTLAAPPPPPPSYTTPPASNPTNFRLVTTTQNTPVQNSSHLTNVSATSLFDPVDQPNFLLRLIGPGYLSLPTFNLTQNTLHTLSEGPEGFGEFVYNSTTVEVGQELQFLPKSEGKGNLALQDGFLLTVGGRAVGWSICPGPEDESVIVWKGGKNCTDTFVQAVKEAPY